MMNTRKVRYVLSIDQSTSATKAIIFDETGCIIQRTDIPHRQIYPQEGWVEHDPEEIYSNTLSAIKKAITESHIDPELIAVLTITNQRETALVWDRSSGKPIYNAVVWQCRRGSEICIALKEQGLEEVIQKKTGLALSPFFTATKIAWILKNVSGAKKAAQEGKLLCGTMDSWLIWKLTQGEHHLTDFSNASRTQLLNLETKTWDSEILSAFDIPQNMLPRPECSDAIFGTTDLQGEFPSAIPISGVMGDSHASLFGHGCFTRGMIKATYGTGSSIMMHTGKNILLSSSGLSTSIAWGMKGQIEYVLEGNINSAGSILIWLKENLNLLESVSEAAQIAESISDTGGVHLVPAFAGLGAPYWNTEVRASISGMTRGTNKAHIIRAAEESIAYQVRSIIELMEHDSGMTVKELKTDGGLSKDRFLMQFQADICGIPVCPSVVEELSAAGSAFMGGIAVQIWKDTNDLPRKFCDSVMYNPRMSHDEAQRRYQSWKVAVEHSISKGSL